MDAGLREREFWSMTPCEITREIRTRVRVLTQEVRLWDSRLAWATAQLVSPHVKRGNPNRLMKHYLKALGVTSADAKIDEEEHAEMLAESRERARKAAVTNGHSR